MSKAKTATYKFTVTYPGGDTSQGFVGDCTNEAHARRLLADIYGRGCTFDLAAKGADIDAEYQAYQDELDAEDWNRSCQAMKRAEQNFGY